jgi:hypothetical protein
MEVKLTSPPHRNSTENVERLQAQSIQCLTHTKIYYLTGRLNIKNEATLVEASHVVFNKILETAYAVQGRPSLKPLAYVH